jgi:hypothetical protein
MVMAMFPLVEMAMAMAMALGAGKKVGGLAYMAFMV